MMEIGKSKNYAFRAKMPGIVRAAAIGGLAVSVLIIGIGFYRGSSRDEFRMKGLPTQLSKDVIGEVTGYDRSESENGIAKYRLTADSAKTFSDNHQELEKVLLNVFKEGNEEDFDKISANKAIYIPATDGSKNFKIFFAGAVDVKTHDALALKTEQLSYDKTTEIAIADEHIDFTREKIKGSADGAIAKINDKTLELKSNVKIDAYASGKKDDELTEANIKYAKIEAGHALIEQAKQQINLDSGVKIFLEPDKNSKSGLDKKTDIESARATVFLEKKEITRIEFFENVKIATSGKGAEPLRIKSDHSIYFRKENRFELTGNVEIDTTNDSKPTKIRSNSAVYDQVTGKVVLTGGASIEQGRDLIRGNRIDATLDQQKRLKFAEATGDAYLKQVGDDRDIEVFGQKLTATLGGNQNFQSARASGNPRVVVYSHDSASYTTATLTAPDSIDLTFKNGGVLDTMKSRGRTTIRLDAPDNSPDAADKILTADRVETYFKEHGNELERATALGNAILVATPKHPDPKNYKTTIKAERFDCDFFGGNNAKNCWTTGRSKVDREPTSGAKKRQELEANKLNVVFENVTQDIDILEAEGKAQFKEGDRQGIADKIVFRGENGVVQLRGSEPTVWDSQARAKAEEIDWDTRNNKSILHKGVRTTYFSQQNTGGAVPFTGTKSPVYLTADEARFDHKAETAVYRGNARAWQENNYVRAVEIRLNQKNATFNADGDVQTLLYDVKRTVAGRKSSTPVYVSSEKMDYVRALSRIRYQTKVDMRQGADRIRGDSAEIYLDGMNNLSRSVIRKDVIITQPKRRATGVYAEYDARGETVILRGNPAHVSDSENGNSSGDEITVYMKENRVVSKGKAGKGKNRRLRTVHKITKGKVF